MASRIFFNVHSQGVPDTNYLLQMARDMQPAWALIMDGLGLAQRIKEAVPTCNVIHRQWPDENPQDWNAAQWVAHKKAEISGADVWCYTFNEKGFTDDYLRLTIDIIYEAAKQGLKVAVLNIAVGNPQPEEWDKPLALELLRALDAHREIAVLGLHSYAGGVVTSGFYGGYPDNAGVHPGEEGGQNLIPPANWPDNPYPCYHMGRFQFMIDACNKASIPFPRVVITEAGFDNCSDIKPWFDTLIKTPPYEDIRGWKTLKNQWAAWYPQWSHERAYYEQLAYADRTLYQGSCVEGQLLFSWGHSSNQWEMFDIAQAYDLHARLKEYATGTPPDTGDGGEEIPVGKIDLHPYFRGDGRWYDLNHNVAMGGGWETVSTQSEAADARIFLHQKNSQYERLCLHNGFICRDLDTSPGNNEAYRLTDGSAAWSKWCPQFMAVGEKYQRNPTVTFLNKSDGSLANKAPNPNPYTDLSTIQLEKVWASYPIPENTYVIADVIQLAFFPAGATVATERYFYAKRYGLIRWEHQDKRVSFIQHLTTTTTPLPTIEQLGAWANPPTIPAESTTPPPVTYPPKPASAAEPEAITISDTWKLRFEPDTSAAQIGMLREGEQVTIYRTPETNNDNNLWHFAERLHPVAGEAGQGYTAFPLPAVEPEPEPEPPPIEKPVTLTLSLKVLAPPGTDPATLEATLKGLVLVIGEANSAWTIPYYSQHDAA